VVAGANAVADLTSVSLVLNVKGAERAIAAGARHITYVVSASEAHSQSNVRCSTQEALDRFPNVTRLFRGAAERTERPLGAHFHDTRGLGLANVVAALDTGVRHFDASLGGLGGCPFAPGASGNIATEDCVYLLESLGVHTGVSIDAMIALRQQLAVWLPDEALTGKLALAGPARTFSTASVA